MAQSRNVRFAWLAALIFLLGCAGSAFIFINENTASRERILAQAELLAGGISSADLEALSGSMEDIDTSEYRALKNYLTTVREVSQEIRFAYILQENDRGELYFVVDSEDASSPDYSPPGQVYYEATETLLEVFRDGFGATEGPERDRWGIWMSAYAPIIDDHHTIIAVLGIDIPATRYITDITVYTVGPLGTALGLIIILALGRRMQTRA